MNPNVDSAGEIHPQSTLFSFLRQTLLGRLYLLAAMGAAEGVFFVGTLRVGPTLHSHLFPAAVVAFGVFLTLGRSWLKAQQEEIPFGSLLFGGYLVFLAIGILSRLVSSSAGAGSLPAYARSVADSPLLDLRLPFLIFACIPFRTWIKMLRGTSPLWLYASLAGAAAWGSGFPIRVLIKASSAASAHFLQVITVRSLEPFLRLLLPGFTVDPATFIVGTPRFSVVMAPGCSGLEGLGMVLAFTSVWLWYSRKECRFPQAFLLIPFALVCIWWLNILRLSLLILVGDAVSPEIAWAGVHAHVGWIAFIVVALSFFLATERLSWVRKRPLAANGGRSLASGATHEERGESPAIRPYLVPFLAIMAASFVSKSVSGYFEWLYPLRFIVAIVALRYFWPELKKLNWRFGWLAPLMGFAVFLLWVAPSWLAHQRAASPLGQALDALSPTARWIWIAFRVAAALLTVPIAEELAFRGYLARRFVSKEFDRVSFTGLRVFAVLLSSVAFGLMHMQNLRDWPHLMLGTVAGLAFAAALRWKGRMGDAVAAHATCNLLLAAWVLILGDWAQW